MNSEMQKQYQSLIINSEIRKQRLMHHFAASAYGLELAVNPETETIDIALLVAKKIFLLENNQSKEINLDDLKQSKYKEEGDYRLRFQLYDDIMIEKDSEKSEEPTFLELYFSDDLECMCNDVTIERLGDITFYYKKDPNIVLGQIHLDTYMISPFWFGYELFVDGEDILKELVNYFTSTGETPNYDPKNLKKLLASHPIWEYVPKERLGKFYSWIGELVMSGRLDNNLKIGFIDFAYT
ncbi:hypothetical protein LCGC14_2542370 [marine sediment metagenome]|uniref:Uncharacterized protein n=2 Tax=root TaxID=1 RepID=A0A0F9BD72_9ZZZZ|nr:MAG: hypothetical protein LCMAC202_05830 [Marseillevirus LCMAC202]